MRQDSTTTDLGPHDPPADSRPAPTGSRLSRAVPVALGGLVVGTGAALAALAWWLVPPYLALMGLLLLEPAGRRVNATNPAGPESTDSGGFDPSEDDGPVDGAGRPDDDPTGDDHRPDDPLDAATASTRGRRPGRGRARKGRPASEPSPAVWVRVGPGKFVRSEPGEPLAGFGPHPPEGDVAGGSPPATTPDSPDRPPADPGPQDFPTEPALELPQPHDDPRPPGPPPDGPRDSHDAVADDPDVDAPLHPDPDPATRADLPGPEGTAEADRPGPDPGPAADTQSVAAGIGWPGPDSEATPFDWPGADADPDDLDPDPAPEAVRDDPQAVGDEPPAGESAPDAEAADDGRGAEVEPGPAVDDPQAEGDEPDAAGSPVDRGPDGPGADWEWDEGGWPDDDAPTTAPGMSWPRVGPAPGSGRGVPPSRRNVRSPRAGLPPAGYRRRSKRGDGRRHHPARAFPPRSPPRRWPARG